MARIPIHPGEILADELAELNLTDAQLALALHTSRAKIRQMLSAERPMSADFVLHLRQWLGTGPELWLNLQEQYDRRMAKA